MKLFSKDNDYNLILEKILDSKYFSSNSKSLLLSMVYKIENFYTDYQKVKNINKTKEEFLEKIIDTIKKYCDNIKLVEPDSKDAKILKDNNVLALTNERERSILSYPTEIALLYAISDVLPKYFYIPENFILKNSFQNMLVNGYNQNNVEVLSDFNGWSWDINVKLKNNLMDNLIYQNLVIMFGINFMDDWMECSSIQKNPMQEVKKEFLGTKYFDILCKYLYNNSNEKEKKRIDKIIERKKIEYDKISNKSEFFNEITAKKLTYLKQLEKIDILLNDKEKLMKKYISVNLKLDERKKFKTVNSYRKTLELKREEYLKQINFLGNLMKPVNFINYKKELEDSIKFSEYQNPDEINENLQIEFVKALERVIDFIEDSEEIIDYIYKLRYYKNLYINENTKISDIRNINIDRLLKKLILKGCNREKPVIRKIVSNLDINCEIIKTILDTKIIDLQEIKFEVIVKDKNLLVKVYEEEVYEKEFEVEYENSKKDILIKQNKMFKLFV